MLGKQTDEHATDVIVSIIHYSGILFTGNHALFSVEFHTCRFQTWGGSGECNFAGLLVGADNGGKLTVEHLHEGSLERFERSGIAVGRGMVFTGAFDLEVDPVGGIGTEIAILIDYLYIDEGEIAAVGFKA